MGVVVAAITAYIDQPTVDQIYDCGMIQALQKPVKSAVIDELVKKHYRKISPVKNTS